MIISSARVCVLVLMSQTLPSSNTRLVFLWFNHTQHTHTYYIYFGCVTIRTWKRSLLRLRVSNKYRALFMGRTPSINTPYIYNNICTLPGVRFKRSINARCIIRKISQIFYRAVLRFLAPTSSRTITAILVDTLYCGGEYASAIQMVPSVDYRAPACGGI